MFIDKQKSNSKNEYFFEDQGNLINWLQKKENFFTLIDREDTNFNDSHHRNLFWTTCFLLTSQKGLRPSTIWCIIKVNEADNIYGCIKIEKELFDDWDSFVSLLRGIYIKYRQHNKQDPEIDFLNILFYGIFIPAEIGNIFHKKRYTWEINSQHINSLKAEYSLDRTSQTILDNYIIDKSSAITHQLLNNNYDTYSNDVCYIDIFSLSVGKNSHEDVITNILSYYEIKTQKISEFMDILNETFFDSVIIQQDRLIKIINHNLYVGDTGYKIRSFANPKSIKNFLEEFRKELHKDKKNYSREELSKLDKCLKNLINKKIVWKFFSSTIKKISKKYLKKDDDCGYVLGEILSQYPAFKATDIINEMKIWMQENLDFEDTHCLENTCDELNKLIGVGSILFYKDDKQKYFYYDVYTAMLDYIDHDLTCEDVHLYNSWDFYDDIKKTMGHLKSWKTAKS